MMQLSIPDFSRRNYGFARAGAAVISALILFILSRISGAGEFLGNLRNTVHLDGPVLSLLYWVLLFLLLNESIIRLVRTMWFKFEKKPLTAAVLKTADLRINTSRGISGIPVFRERLKREMASGETGAVEIVNRILGMGFSLGASDIHISPDPETVNVNFRISGNLYSLGEINREVYPHFVRRIKILSGLSIFKQSIPQDGQLNFEDRSYTTRVSVFPTISGERIALRLADSGAGILELEKTGMPYSILPDYKALLNRSQGMIVINGPTGSGKTTTLFSSLLHIQTHHKDSVNIVTLEDPIEIKLKGLQQTQVDQGTGLSFSSGLRSVLRQDPDVIMVGEIRDEETAEIAIRAAMTGHLLLTTVHANSTAGVFNRLTQMGIDPVQLSATVHAVISQRLCRQLCQTCKKETPLTDDHARQLKLLGVSELPEGPFFEAEGCEECLGQGFAGRAALFEMLLVTDAMRDFIAEGTPAHVLSRKAKQLGMPTLLSHGLELAREGKISLMELTRVISD